MKYSKEEAQMQRDNIQAYKMQELEEYRMDFISHAGTKGIDPSVAGKLLDFLRQNSLNRSALDFYTEKAKIYYQLAYICAFQPDIMEQVLG